MTGRLRAANAAALLVATRGSLLGISWWWQAVSPAPAQYSAVAFLSLPGDLAISEGVDGGRPVNATAARQHGLCCRCSIRSDRLSVAT